MDVERTVRRNPQHARWKNQAVGSDDQDVGPSSGQLIGRPAIFEGIRLEYGQSALEGEFLDRARRRTQAAPRRTIRLRQHQCDFVAGGKQRGQRARREVWRAGEN